MTDRSSRHADAETYRVTPEVELLTPRMRTRPPTTRQHTARVSDRLDLLAAAYLGDPHLFWRIADANPALDLDRVVDPGRPLDIPGPTP